MCRQVDLCRTIFRVAWLISTAAVWVAVHHGNEQHLHHDRHRGGAAHQRQGLQHHLLHLLQCRVEGKGPTNSHGQTFDPLHFGYTFSPLLGQHIKVTVQGSTGHQPFLNKMKYCWPKVSVWPPLKRVVSVLGRLPFFKCRWPSLVVSHIGSLGTYTTVPMKKRKNFREWGLGLIFQFILCCLIIIGTCEAAMSAACWDTSGVNWNINYKF